LSIANISSPGSPPRGMAVVDFAARPVALEDGLIMIRHTGKTIDALKQSPDYPAWKKLRPPEPPEVMNNRWRHVVASMLLPAYDRSGLSLFRGMTERHLAAAALAIRMYQVDHNGALPAKLEELVPKYLPAVPMDPMSSGAALKYLPAATQPVVYSIGDNGTDEGGSEAPLTVGRTVQWKWDAQDAVTHLTPQPRKSPQPEEIKPLSGVDAESLASPATQPATTTRPSKSSSDPNRS
jgi:hypothetical protein